MLGKQDPQQNCGYLQIVLKVTAFFKTVIDELNKIYDLNIVQNIAVIYFHLKIVCSSIFDLCCVIHSVATQHLRDASCDK